MKQKLFVYLCLFFALTRAAPLFAAGNSGTITSAQCVTLDVSTQGTVGIQVTGTWTGTLQPQVSVGGQAAQNTQVTPAPPNSSPPQSTITANGVYTASTAGATLFQICGATVGSGTANVYLNSTAANSSNGGGGLSTVALSGDAITLPSPEYASGVGSQLVSAPFTFKAGLVQMVSFRLLRYVPVMRAYEVLGPGAVPGTHAYFGIYQQNGNNCSTATKLTEIIFDTSVASASIINASPQLTLAPGRYCFAEGGDEVAGTQSCTVTQVQIASNVATITCNNTFVPTETVSPAGLSGAAFLNGQSLTITAAVPTSFTANFTHANYGPTADSGTAATNQVFVHGEGYSFDSDYANVAGLTCVNTISGGHLPASCGGQEPNSNIAAITNAAISSNVLTLTLNAPFGLAQPFSVGNSLTFANLSNATFLNGQQITVASTPDSRTLTATFAHADYTSRSEGGTIALTSVSAPVTGVVISGNVATITASNTFSAGQTVTFGGVTNAGFLNGLQAAVLAAGLSSSQFELRIYRSDYPAVATSDSLTTNVATVITNNNFTVGQSVSCSGFTNMAFLNGQTLSVASASAIQFTANFTHANVGSAAETGTCAATASETGFAMPSATGNGNYKFSSPTIQILSN